jgi:hypothetical protein
LSSKGFRWLRTRRDLPPIGPKARRSALLKKLAALLPPSRIDVYQARHEAGSFPALRPHRDAVDVVIMVLIARRGVTGGATLLYRKSRRVASRVLWRPGSAVRVDDASIRHGVGRMTIRPGGRRDLLILAARKSP